VKLRVFPQKPAVFVTVLTIRTATLLQVSLAVGGSNVGVAGHSITLSAAQDIVGGCRLVTVTRKLQDTDWPAPFRAEQVTVVVPAPNSAPDGGTHTTVTDVSGQPGVVIGVKETRASHRPSAAFVLIFEGQKMEGRSLQHCFSTGFVQAAPKMETRRCAW
jgi:hypothetical protein